MYDLDNKIELQESIIRLSNDIKKYYPASSCIGINGQNCKRPYLSIILFLPKFYDKEFYTMDYRLDIDGKKIYVQKNIKLINFI